MDYYSVWKGREDWTLSCYRALCNMKEANHRTQILHVYTCDEVFKKLSNSQSESWMAMARATQGLPMSYLFTGDEVSVMQDKKHSGDRCIAVSCSILSCTCQKMKKRYLSPQRCEFDPGTHIKSQGW